MTLKEFKEWLENNKGKEFQIKFKKKDGKLREMKCMYGVEFGLIKNPYRPGSDWSASGLICVYDLGSQQYKSFREDNLLEVFLPSGLGWVSIALQSKPN